MDGDLPQSLATFTVLSLTPGLRSSPNVYPGKVLLTDIGPIGSHVALNAFRRPAVIVRWHLGNWKCFSWVWATPYAEEGPPASMPPSLFLCEPDRDMWYVAPCWGWKHWSGWLMLPHFGNSSGHSHWTVNRHPAFRSGNRAPAMGLTRCLVKWNMRQTLNYRPITMTIDKDFMLWFSYEGITGLRQLCEAAENFWSCASSSIRVWLGNLVIVSLFCSGKKLNITQWLVNALVSISLIAHKFNYCWIEPDQLFAPVSMLSEANQLQALVSTKRLTKDIKSLGYNHLKIKTIMLLLH